MQLFLLNDSGLILGATSIEGTVWRMSDEGYTNESLVRVKLDVYGHHPTKYRLENSNQAAAMVGPVVVPKPVQNHSVIFWPGTMFFKHDWSRAVMFNAQ